MWDQNPGDYRCVATAAGETVKELFFTIGADGTVVNNDCQAQVKAPRHLHLLKAKDGFIANFDYDKKALAKGYWGRASWNQCWQMK
jgi:hypothetical protein